MPARIPGFARGPLENRPFHLSPYISAEDNVAFDPMHAFRRMLAQINRGRMDQFVALAELGKHEFAGTEQALRGCVRGGGGRGEDLAGHAFLQSQ